MKPSNIEDIYPLSPMQKGILFHTLYDPAADHYFRQWSGLLHGRLVVAAFERAWQEVVDRHSILRTAFVWDEMEDPVQVVCRRVYLPCERQDLRSLSSEEQERRLAEYLLQDSARGFDLAQSPLIRLALFQVADDVHRMVWSFHHLLLDGWSVALVMRRVLSCYRSICLGEPLTLARSRPFRDYIAWLKSQDLRQAEEFWRRTLQGFSAPTRLSVDRGADVPPSGLSRAGVEERTVLLSEPTTAALRELTRQHQVTLNTLAQGLWGLLLGRYSGEEDVVFGATVAGRPAHLPGFESMVGLFINTLPVRVRLPGGAQLVAWLRDLQGAQAAARQYDYSPLVDVQGWSEVPRGVPLFHTILVFENYQVDEPSAERDDRLRVEASRFRDGTHYPLTLIVRPRSERLGLRFLWDPRRFETPAVTRLLGQLAALFEAVVAVPEALLGELAWIPEAQRHQLLVEWNDSAAAPCVRCVHELVAEQAARTPERRAVTCDGEGLTYRELDAAANRLANHLRGLGAGPGTLVGIAVERSPRLLVGLLGILKAGGAYVPLDPWYPAERLAFMLEDSGAPLLVTEERWAAAFQGRVPRMLCLDRDLEAIALESPAPSASTSDPDALAYVIYTSGSTGRPKGVQVPHTALINFLTSMRARPGLVSTDRLLAVTSLSFDIACLELYLPLLVGAEVEIASRATAADGAALLARLGPATVLQATPATWRLLLDAGWERSDGLKALCGGEALPGSLAREIAQRAGSAWNMYGPTETAVWSATRAIAGEDGELPGSVPLGRPIANTGTYVLDRCLRPLPVGVPGDLYIGGAGLARGYLGRPDLTAERFLPNPFAGAPGARLYHTGDLARWLGTGELEFLGRSDHQVKIRGFRIELGEIEAVLARQPGVRDAVVLAREVRGTAGAAGDRRLVAYLVAKPGSTLRSSELRSALLESLPDYMTPSVWMFLEVLPLTPNGKVDRRALPEPGAISSAQAVAPRTWMEELLAEVWSEVLKVEGIGSEDDFFALGGHSLLATQVVSRVRRVFGVELALRELFEAPRLAALAERIEMALRAGGGVRVPPMVRVDRGGQLPLSFAQQRLWFLDQLEPGGSTYNIPVAVRLEGALRVEVLEAALEEIVHRHESLRTRFEVVDGAPVQVIEEPERLRLPVVDLGLLSGPLREREARRLAQEEARRPFDLGRGPLPRPSLLRLGPEEHAFLATLHHIITDDWSMGVLRREMGALYRAFAAGEPSPLPELPVQYVDYAAWQRSWLSGGVLEAEVAHWRERLAGAPPLLELPLDRPRPAVQSSLGAREAIRLPSDLSQALAVLARREGSTSFMTLLAAFQALLSRLSGQSEVSVGTPIAGRTLLETEVLIGFFVNTLVLRTNLSGDPPFQELLHRVRETALQAHAHQDAPFEKLVEELSPQRSLSYTPLFQVVFVLQNAPREDLELPGLRLSMFAGAERGTAKFDLTLSLIESRGGLFGSLEYSTDLFDGPTMRRWLEHFGMLLEAVVAEPSRRISELALLSEAERAQLLREWNDTAQAVEERCLDELFAEQVARTPESIALVFEDELLSYRELDARTESLACHLEELGVGPEVGVALCAERSLELVIGMLAVLKTGGYYVPLDPEYPSERLAYMLADSRARVLLLQRGLAGRLTEHRAPVVMLDGTWPVRAGHRARGAAGGGSRRLAYVIYTSGSTGRPKGVLVPHRGVVNRLLWAQLFYPLTASDRVLQKASVSFDFSVWEVLGTLLAGARLVLARPGGHRDGAYLTRTVLEQEITLLHFVPSMLPLFLTAEGVEQCRSLRYVFAGGEVLPLETRHLLFARLPCEVEALHNQYGPTEVSIDATTWVGRRQERAVRSVPIGRPITNVSIYVLDEAFEPVPVGVAGELCIGGAGVVRGYLGHTDRTAERFVPDPFGEPGARLYRTGDLGRWLSEGTLEFLGRRDHQVKVRGFRIELGEIESVLARHAGVREAAVLVREDEPGDRRLVGYVVAVVAGEAPTTGELREFLKKVLPDYMVPSGWVFLERLPLTPSGKVDRRALPAPDRGLAPGEGWVASRSWVEELLAQAWGEVLKVEGIGSEDDFFALGGHSLLATQVVSRVRRLFGVELALRELFEAPRLSALAGRIEAALQAGRGMTAPPLVRVDRHGRLPLSFAQQRLWFLDQLEPGGSTYNVPIVLRLEGTLRVEILAATLEEIVRRHESLRTRFEVVDGEPVQVIEAPPRVWLPVVDLGSLNGSLQDRETRRLAREEARRPFDLGRGPLLRPSLLRVGPEEHQLLATLHHIVSDGWSMGVLRREMGALYQAFAAGEPSPLPELPVQYADYAAWQRGWLSGTVLEAEVSHWREQLAGAPPLLELPLDRPRPAVQSSRGAREGIRLPSDLLEALAVLARREGSTSFMTLLAAFQVLLSRLSGQSEVSVGTPIAGRTRLETESLIGFFVNTLVLRTDLSEDLPFQELLHRVRETALWAHAHQDLPFEKLVEELAPQRSLSYSPLFQVMFVLQNAPREGLELPGLRLSTAGAERDTAKFDLTLGIAESPEGLLGSLEYNTDLFDGSTMRRWLGHFETLLAGVAAEPDRRLPELPLLTSAEWAQLLVEWCDTRSAYPSDRPIHELFEEQAARRPERTAVVFAAEQLSYRELALRASRLADHLRRLGVGPEVAVALCLERSIEMIVGLLAVLKAGGYYVPLDLQAPPQRMASLVQDSGAAVLLAQAELAARIPDGGPPVVFLEPGGRGWWGEEREREPAAARRAGAGPDNLAYVMYTSGSTGQPKGVDVEHRAVVRLVRDNDFARLAPDVVFLQLAPLAFDASTLEIWGPLLNGGTLVVAPAGPVSLEQLGRLLCEHAVTTLWLTAGLFHQMIDERPEDLSGLRELLAGGDVLSAAQVRKLLAQSGPVRLINGYGPTEGTTFTCCHGMARAGDLTRGSVPIGRPIRNSRVHVLDRNLRPAPIGVPGELFAGGDGLARGYHGRADRTAEQFLPDPFGAPGARLYRTGDLVRWLPDGTLEFLGRTDHQAKIRGFRIEPGEIEAALLRHPAVREAAVLMRADGEDKLLVAYVVPAGRAGQTTPGELRTHLRTLLPDYMVPAAWVELAELPLNANGKVDRRALPAPQPQEAGPGFVAPSSPTEEALAAIWAEVLGRGRVGIHDNFFDLGGHSLKATQVVSRVRETFGVELPLRQLFDQPTVAALAACIETSELAALGGAEELESALAALEALSDEEVRALMERGELAGERGR